MGLTTSSEIWLKLEKVVFLLKDVFMHYLLEIMVVFQNI